MTRVTLAAAVPGVATLLALEWQTGLNSFVCLLIGTGAAYLARLIAIGLFVRVEPFESSEAAGRGAPAAPVDQFADMLGSAELSASAQGLPAVLRRATAARPVLLFGPGESEWLWLARQEGDFCIRLPFYPKRLKALRSRFEKAAQNAEVHIEEKLKGDNPGLVCRLGADPRAPGRLAWTIFTETMGLGKDASASMKWL
ncbi:MAG: hypothetical protein L0I62_05950 [Gammaproteobacteria bacterium]|nr:hypothetical protein [Gammaproteobacteria bacterium]